MQSLFLNQFRAVLRSLPADEGDKAFGLVLMLSNVGLNSEGLASVAKFE